MDCKWSRQSGGDSSFDIGQKDVLLRFIEMMDLVDEQDRLLSGCAEAIGRGSNYAAHFGHVAFHAADSNEFGVFISAMTRASVVFPLPGGPEKITDGKRSASMARRKSLPGPRMCSWPTNSSSERGRMRVASGAALSAASTSSACSNKSCTQEITARP